MVQAHPPCWWLKKEIFKINLWKLSSSEVHYNRYKRKKRNRSVFFSSLTKRYSVWLFYRHKSNYLYKSQMLSSLQATISDAQCNALKIWSRRQYWTCKTLNYYLVLFSSTFLSSDEQKSQIKESQVFSSYQATIWDTEDWNNLDQVIVTIQGLEVTKKHKIKCI